MLEESVDPVRGKGALKQILPQRGKDALPEAEPGRQLKRRTRLHTHLLRLGGDEAVEVLADAVPVPPVEVHAKFGVERAHGEPEAAPVALNRDRLRAALHKHAVERTYRSGDVIEQRPVPVPDQMSLHLPAKCITSLPAGQATA